MATNALISSKHKRILVPLNKNVDPASITNLSGAAAIVQHPKGSFLSLPADTPHTKLLRNRGINVKAPITELYDWEGDTPFETQVKTADLLTTSSRAYVLNDMGTGKTRAALHSANFLMLEGEVQKALIIAPLSTLTNVWEDEIFKYFHNRTAAVVYGTREKRRKALEQDVDFYIVNHDAVHIILNMIKNRPDINLIIIDELASFRNARTRRWKALQQLIQGREFVWGMTGSPTPNDPTDAWGQCKLLTPESVPRYFRQFREKTMRQVTQFKFLPKPEANDIVHAAMQPAVRFTREDCIELPDTVYVNRDIPMTSKQTMLYSSMMKHLKVEYQNKQVTAANEGVKLFKLLQICSGFIYDPNGGVISVPAKHRLNALCEVIDENSQKTIVFAPFIETVDAIYQHLTTKYGVNHVEKVYGKTPKKDRDRIFNTFQNSLYPKVLVAHPKTMSHGLTLTAANTIVWYVPFPSPEIYEQANARITRPSQKHKQLVLHLSSSAVEQQAYRRLKNKTTMQGILLDMFASQ